MRARPGAAACAALVLCSTAAAKERLVRQLGVEQGNPPQHVLALGQDPEGRLWVGTKTGLFRYDGVELRRLVAAPEVSQIAFGPDGRVYASAEDGGVFLATREGFEIVPSPAGGEWRNTRRIAVDAAGRLWLLTSEPRLWRREKGGAWTSPFASELAGERPQVLRRDGDGMLLVSRRNVWRASAEDRIERVFALPVEDWVHDVLRAPSGSLFVAIANGQVWEHANGRLALRATTQGRARGLAARGDTVWVVADGCLAAIRPGRAAEELPETEHVAHKGLAILVDREGSLWVGNRRGAFQLPEPDTVAWTPGDGVPRGAMRVARAPDGVWFTYWNGGMGLVRIGEQAPRVETASGWMALDAAVTRAGTLWGAGVPPGQRGARIVSRAAGGGFRFHARLASADFDCGPSPEGGVWMTTSDGLAYASPRDELAMLGFAHEGARRFFPRRPLEDSGGSLWVADEGTEPRAVCRASAAEVRAGRDPSFTCRALPGVFVVEDLAAMPSGALWIAPRWQTSGKGGVLRLEGGRLEAVPGSRELPGPNVDVLAPAKDGGFWISGPGYLWRVEERVGSPEGWRVLETLGARNGLMSDGAFDVVEEEQGTLWAATPAGLLEMPRSARVLAVPHPVVSVVRAAVDGRPVDPTLPLEVPYGRNDVSVEVSALLYRDPAALLYRTRLGPDASWSSPSRSSRIQLVDVPPGRHRLEVCASADGTTWSEPVAVLGFRVPTPWQRRPWVWLLGGCGVLAGALAVQRARQAERLRVERLRTQIALDLHDEIGSSLGSIRLLAGMAAREGVPLEARAQAATRIESTARHLGEALADIVWSLRDKRRTLRDLCDRVAERGHGLFPDGEPAFDVRFPREWPDERLGLSARRNLQLILVEALHNAAKHARARRVELGAALDGARWRLWVEDDGVGLDTASPREAGNGLYGMRKRASEIGAVLEVGSAKGAHSGTRVEVLTSREGWGWATSGS